MCRSRVGRRRVRKTLSNHAGRRAERNQMAEMPAEEATPPLAHADVQIMLENAFGRLRDEEPELLGTTERVLAGRMMLNLHEDLQRRAAQNAALRGYTIDLEYERAGVDPKRVTGMRTVDDVRRPFQRKIAPDLLIHRRRLRRDSGARIDPFANLLAVEIKTNPSGDLESDRAKLRLLTGMADWVQCQRRGRGTRLHGGGQGVAPEDIDWVQRPDRDRMGDPYIHGALLVITPDGMVPEWFGIAHRHEH
jgi:hypothetical protein